MAINNINPS